MDQAIIPPFLHVVSNKKLGGGNGNGTSNWGLHTSQVHKVTCKENLTDATINFLVLQPALTS